MAHIDPSAWEPVIGLEIHVELNTASKLFSAAPNHFGDEPNTNISEVCTGQPGSLPVLNKEVVKKAVQFGCAINGHVQTVSKFDRKSYFYPDSPRNFQITQFNDPIVRGGSIIAEVGSEEHTFAVHHVHIEDDAGMLKHFSNFTGVDYNRAGVPLIEIVSEPCMHTPQQASAYAMAVKAILQYIDVSDCNMEEGSLRFDVNISVRPRGEQTLRTKVEIKNLNSFNFMELSIESEILRQIRAYTNHPEKPVNEVIQQSTYRWDPEKKSNVLMRRKEYADDYRYFPEPDLLPIVLSAAYIDDIRSRLPELPLQRQRRYVRELGLTRHVAYLLASDKAIADYFEEALEICQNARSLGNWILAEFAGRLKESGLSIIEAKITPQNLGHLVAMIESQQITGPIAKSVADEMLLHPEKDCRKIVADNPDYNPVHNSLEIELLVDQILTAHPQSVSDYRIGKLKAFGFLVGQVMKLSRGKASPQVVNDLLKNKLN